MQSAAIPILLLALLIGHTQDGSEDHPPSGVPHACPEWFEHAPRLGPGRPEAVVGVDLASVTVCRYFENPNLANGPGLPPNNKLANEKTLQQRQTARSLAHAFNRLRPYPTPEGGMPLCAAEFGGGFYLQFLYSDGRQASIEVVPSGCPRAVPGKHGDWLLLSGDLRQRLRKIAPIPRQVP
jgi:hypothetical protein